jgi:hypothetical protein
VINDPEFDSGNFHEPNIPPPLQDYNPTSEGFTKDGFPLISTENNGRVVLLTGVIGPGNFREVDNFYSEIVNNRLEYANHHGISTSFTSL